MLATGLSVANGVGSGWSCERMQSCGTWTLTLLSGLQTQRVHLSFINNATMMHSKVAKLTEI